MKKFVILLTVLLLLTAVAIPAFAANTEVAVTGSTDIAYAGDEVTFSVAASGDVPYTSFGVMLTFDEQVFEFVSVEEADTGALLQNYDKSKNTFIMAFQDPTAYTGTIFTVKLKVKADAPFVTATVSGQVSAKNGNDAVESTLKSAQVAIGCRHNYTWDAADADSHTGTCSVCGDVKTETHTWADEGINITPATCTDTGSETFECLLCRATKTVELPAKGHAWDNNCDADCNNGCGTTREITHKYATAFSSNDQQHWHECEICGDKKDVSAHTPGAAATETQAQVCTACARVLQTALGHVHDFETAWQEDADAHWHICKKVGCYDRDQYAYHDYDNGCDVTCNTCGHIRVAPHEFGMEWRGNETGHWHVCLLCSAQSEISAHVPGAAATTDTPQVCTECQFVLQPPLNHEHTYGTVWEANEQGHWQICTACDAPSNVLAHVWGDGIIVAEPTQTQEGSIRYICMDCDMARTETLPPVGTETTTPTDDTQEPSTPSAPVPIGPGDEGGFPWWILVVLAVILMLLGIALFVIELVRSKKSNMRGKFSGK